MKNILRSLFNFEIILSSFIGAIGYGVGYNLPNKFNVHPILCLIYCLALGMIFDLLSEKILSCSFFKKSRRNKIITAICVYIGYLISWVIVDRILNYDLDNDFIFNIIAVMVIQIILLLIRIIKEFIKNRRKRKKE